MFRELHRQKIELGQSGEGTRTRGDLESYGCRVRAEVDVVIMRESMIQPGGRCDSCEYAMAKADVDNLSFDVCFCPRLQRLVDGDDACELYRKREVLDV